MEPITKVDFVAVPATDADRLRGFYVDTLGLRPDAQSQYEFWVGETFSASGSRRRWNALLAQKNAHIALHVDDIEAARSDLEARGVEFLGETFDTGVCKMALFIDPDGNDLMLHSRYAPHGEQQGASE